MNFNNKLQSSEEMKLSYALLIYQSKSKSYASKHQVFNLNDKLMIGAGTGVEIDEVESLLNELNKSSDTGGFINERIIYSTANTKIWWKPASMENIYIKVKDEDTVSGKVMHPALLFMVSGRKFYVYALKNNERPDENTELFHAPYFNLYDAGNMCTGNVLLPESVNKSNLKDWENVLFDSWFTHANCKKVIKDKSGFYLFWITRLNKKVAFPVTKLFSMDKVIGDLVNEL